MHIVSWRSECPMVIARVDDLFTRCSPRPVSSVFSLLLRLTWPLCGNHSGSGANNTQNSARRCTGELSSMYLYHF
jgi:hypothetical protein